MMKTAIAVFCKTPGVSPVKTRLANDIGLEKAESFYLNCIFAVRETMLSVRERSCGRITPYWAVAEKESLANVLWKSLPTVWTGEGGLGERLNNVFALLFRQYDNVIVIGSDSPQLSPVVFFQAADRLNSPKNDCVIGPCTDGGFYLFGSNKSIAKSVWARTEYSNKYTLTQLVNLLDHYGYQFSFLPELADVDDLSGLENLAWFFKDNPKSGLAARNELILHIKSILAC